MRIVHIEDFFHPDAGYQVNILSKYQAQQGHSVVVVTAAMDKMPATLTSFFKTDSIETIDREFSLRTGIEIVRIPLITYISGRAIYHSKIFRIVDSLSPDILYVHGNDTYIGARYILRAKRLEYPVISDNHMLDMASDNPFNTLFRYFYKKFITSTILKRDIRIIRVVDDPYIEKRLGIPLNKSILMPLGTDIDLFKPDDHIRKSFRVEYSIDSDDFVVIYAGKLDEAKGGLFYARAIKEKLLSQSRNIVFVVIGNIVGSKSDEIALLLKESGNRILRFPTQKYNALARFYQMSDLAVFPQQCSLSFFDVQACGLPVLAEDNIINLQRVSNQNGFTFRKGDIDDLRNLILKCAEMESSKFNCLKLNSENFILTNYNYKTVAKKYTKVMENEVSKFNTSRNLHSI